MNRETWIVKQNDVRPARPDGTCFYCRQPLYSEHAQGCVIRSRTIIVELKVELLTVVPEDWDEQQINFNMNDSSSCSNNLIDKLTEQLRRMEASRELIGDSGASMGVCMCSYTEGQVLREATQEDEDVFGMPEL